MTAPKVLSARAVRVVTGIDTDSNTHVTVDFDQSMDISSLQDRLLYSFDGGLLVLGVEEISAVTDRITLTTTPQVLGRQYTLYVSASVENSGNENLDQTSDTAVVSGFGSPDEYVVQNLVARPNPGGGTVDLFWDDHESGAPGKIIIVRRAGSWVFDDTDPGEVVFASGLGGLFSDPLGVYDRWFQDTGLTDGKFYYYVVAISLNPAAGFSEMVVTTKSRALCLSVPTFETMKLWLANRIPVAHLDRDTEAGSFLQTDVLTLMAGWLAVAKAYAVAARLGGDWLEAPATLLPSLHESAGMSPPEGDTYDFDTWRRSLVELSPRWGKKGRFDNLKEVVWILVKWECDIRSFGVWERSSLFGTYDPDSRRSDGIVTDLGDVGEYVVEDAGRSPWEISEWVGARMLDGFGNWLNVADNDATFLTLSPESSDDRRYLLVALPLAQQYVELNSVFGVLVGQRLQLRNPTTGAAEVIQVVLVSGGTGRIYFWNILENTYDEDSYVSFQVTSPVAHMIGDVASAALNTLEASAQGGALTWETNQWAGFIVCDSLGAYHTVVSSTADTLTFDDGSTPPSGVFTLARAFSSGSVGNLYFWLYYGHTPRLYDPQFDNALRGTRFDPFYYLYSGRSGRRSGRWGSCDVGVYITTTDAALVRSRWTNVSGAVLEDLAGNWATDELVGNYLNPNQNQGNVFLIVGNTNNTITVSGRIDTIAVAGQAYVVLTPRNLNRYRALSSRLQEFVADGIHPRVLFF